MVRKLTEVVNFDVLHAFCKNEMMVHLKFVLYKIRSNCIVSLTFTAASNDVLGLAKETITEFQKPVSFSRVVSMVKSPKVK